MVAGAEQHRRHGPVAARRDGRGFSSTGRARRSTLGSFLRVTLLSFGHVRQGAPTRSPSRFLTALAKAQEAPQVTGEGTGGRVLVDVDDTMIEVHGYARAGRRVRLLQGARPERADRHRHHCRVGTGGRSATAAQGIVRITRVARNCFVADALKTAAAPCTPARR